jgi:hypothetical protein
MLHLTATASAMLRRIRRQYLQVKSKLRGNAFCCAALDGRSEFNLCINSDLTVSCNCHDVDGSGHIGDLSRESLAEVLSGPTARRFREELAQGRLPIPQCSRCCDLHAASKQEAQRLVEHRRLPTFVQVENTSLCNLRCLSCPRGRIHRLRRRPSMSLDDVRRVADEIKRSGITSVGFVNLGEPFLSKHIRRELEIIRELNPGLRINTSTNALLIDSDEKREAALLLDKIQISLDGINQRMASKYQRGMDFERAFGNMQALVEYRDARGLSRPIIIWKYLLFRWNDRQDYLRTAIEMGRAAGVDLMAFERTFSPFYALPLRYYLGLLDGVGKKTAWGILVALREHPQPACLAAGGQTFLSVNDTMTDKNVCPPAVGNAN